jgi:hypothetical protein
MAGEGVKENYRNPHYTINLKKSVNTWGFVQAKNSVFEAISGFPGAVRALWRARLKKNYFFLDFRTAEYYIDVIAIRGKVGGRLTPIGVF